MKSWGCGEWKKQLLLGCNIKWEELYLPAQTCQKRKGETTEQPKLWKGVKNYYRRCGLFLKSCFLGHKSGASWGCSLKHENMSFWYFWYLQYHQAGERFCHRILMCCQILVVSPLTSPLPGLLVRLLYFLVGKMQPGSTFSFHVLQN